jgi:hypothetical protein
MIPSSESASFDLVGSSLIERRTGEQTVREQAALDFSCPQDRIALRKLRNDPIYEAEGCNKRDTYVSVFGSGQTSEAPGHRDASTSISIQRFVPVAYGDPTAAIVQLEGVVAGLHVRPPPRAGDTDMHAAYPGVFEWVDLGQAATRDLSCPRELISLDIVSHSRAPSTYLAEGCGFRGSFVKNSASVFVIISRVEIGRPPLTHSP